MGGTFAARLRPGRALVVILAVALLARLAALAAGSPYAPMGDPADYDRHAWSLATTGGYPLTAFADPGGATALRPPGYPLFLAAVYEVTGARWTAGRLAGVALGLLTVVLLFALARSLYGTSTARWAGGLAAVFPPLVWLSAGLSAENLFLPLMLGAVLALVAHRRSGGLRWLGAAGGLIALATLTRSNGAVLLVPAAVAAVAAGGPVLRAGGRRRTALATAVLLGSFAVVMAPWTIRNALVFDRFLPMGTQSGYTIAGQYNDQAAKRDAFEATWRVPQTIPGFADLFHRPGLDEGDVDAALRRRGLDFATGHPGYVLRVAHLNARRMFDTGPNRAFTSDLSYREMGVPPRYHPQLRAWLHGVVLLGVVGAVLLVRRRAAGPLFVWLVPLALFASVVLLLAAPRYRAPLDPFLVMLAAVPLAGAWRYAADRRSRRAVLRAG